MSECGQESPGRVAVPTALLGKNSGEHAELVIVGIGASAGGLEALTTMLEHLHKSKRMCFVIAQHLDPKRPSLLLPLLARHTSMVIREIKDGIGVQGGVVYVAPPNRNVRYRQGKLRLIQPPPAISPKPSVDDLFESIAEEKGEFSVGIVLSGTGSDGTMGIRTIKAAGGFAIVQNKGTAKFDDMPCSARATGVVDLVLPPENIGAELHKLVKVPRVLPAGDKTLLPRDSYDQIVGTLEASKGAIFTDCKESLISHRIERRMAANSIAKLTDYSEFLRQSPREIDSLFREILGPVTSLIRDAEAWDFIGQIIRLIVTGKQESDAIRVWAPGCATGEELYSLAILFLDALKENANKYELQFCGTDLDEGAIDFARRAVYPASAISTLPGHLVDTYFTRTGDSYQVHTQVRDIVTFARHDVGHDSPLMHLDLISCRNLLMYFKAELQTSIVSTLHASLEPDGYLFLGKHEMLAGFADLFSVYDRRHKIFQRRSSTASHPGRGRHFRPSSPGISSGASRRSPDEMTNEAIAQKYDLSQETLTKIAALEIELGSTQERLQMTTEELEMTNVELQSLNAELQSSNAELQATNEKLITVNQEFNIKASDLAGVNSDLENILNMLEVPVVLLNKEMAVTRFTAAAIDMFDISTAKGGEVVAKIGNKTAQPDLSNDIYSVIATGKPIARDVEGGSKCYLMKITPCLSEHRQICGVMLSFYAYGELPMSFSRLRLKKSGNRQKQ